MKKSLVILSVLMMSAISLSACNTSDPSEDQAPETEVSTESPVVSAESQTYESEDFGVRFEYPGTWTVESESDDNTLVYLNPNDGTQELVSISRRKNTSDTTDIAQWYEEDSPLTTPFSEWEQTEINGLPALKMEAYTLVVDMDGKQSYLIENGISMNRGAINEDDYNMVVDSFEVLQ